MRDIQFVSYDGEYPTLCQGVLILEIDKKKCSFKHCLVSGGCFRDNVTYEGDWEFIPDSRFSDEEIDFICDLINKNITNKGCCGGCIKIKENNHETTDNN